LIACRTTAEPMKPAPPVMSTFMGCRVSVVRAGLF
jgi:hypothetical protein